MGQFNIPQNVLVLGRTLGTTSNLQVNSLGVGVAASGTAGRIDATTISLSSGDTTKGVIALASSTSATAGITWGADTSLYRLAGGSLVMATSGTNPQISLNEGGTTNTLRLESSNGTSFITALGTNSLILRTNSITAMTISATQVTTFAGTVSATTNFLVGATAGITGTMTTSTLVGKTLTFTGGLITGFA